MLRISLFVCLLFAAFGQAIHPGDRTAPVTGGPGAVAPTETPEKIRLEADHIVACQYLNLQNPQDPANGAINDVCGSPTYVVPGEVAMAILGLQLASQVLDDPFYLDRAELAADYLVRVQRDDGGWCDQYDHANCVVTSESLRHAAEIMIAFFKLGYQPARYDAMKRAAGFLLENQKPPNKGGNNDGLVGGGKDTTGNYQKWRWTSDNSYAYWALRMCALWARWHGDESFASTCANGAAQILAGINQYLYDPATGVWHTAVDEHDAPQDDLPNWIQYAPQMLDMPVRHVNSPEVGEWVHQTFQQSDGACVEYYREGTTVTKRESPGFSFQCALAWFDTGHPAYALAAIHWAESGGLWVTGEGCDGCKGGFIDWLTVDPPNQAPCWQRYIDTSAYAIMVWNGGFFFGIPASYLPLVIRG